MTVTYDYRKLAIKSDVLSLAFSAWLKAIPLRDQESSTCGEAMPSKQLLFFAASAALSNAAAFFHIHTG
jgi:hypothetical protein